MNSVVAPGGIQNPLWDNYPFIYSTLLNFFIYFYSHATSWRNEFSIVPTCSVEGAFFYLSLYKYTEQMFHMTAVQIFEDYCPVPFLPFSRIYPQAYYP